MPYTAEHKARTRERIVASARRLFNRFGFGQVSIDQIMAGAKLTRGGFYNHFSSKDELYVAAVASYATCSGFAVKVREARPKIVDPHKLARMLVSLYLCDEVLQDVDVHCPLYALPSDVARAGRGPRKAYTDLMHGMLRVYRAALEGVRDADRRAQTIVSLCVGGMVLSRTTDDPELRKSLRAAARQQALTLLESGVSARSPVSR